MSLIKTIRAQLGLSVTPANNFTLDASADNGTMLLERGNGQDIMTVDAAGKVAFPQEIASVNSLPVFQCRAWVNFDGQRNISGGADSANTARFIRGAGNIASVVKSGVASFSVTLSVPMPDSNYAIFLTCGADPSEARITSVSVGGFTIQFFGSAGFETATALGMVAVFR